MDWLWGGKKGPAKDKQRPMKIQDLESILEKRMSSNGDIVKMKIGDNDFVLMDEKTYIRIMKVVSSVEKMSNMLRED